MRADAPNRIVAPQNGASSTLLNRTATELPPPSRAVRKNAKIVKRSGDLSIVARAYLHKYDLKTLS